MTEHETKQKLIDLMPSPCFLVQEEKILCCNRQAAAYLLEPGTQIAPLLGDGIQDLYALEEGSLYLPLTLGTETLGATVVPFEGCLLFRLDAGSGEAMNALSQVGIAIRRSLGNLKQLAQTLEPSLEEDNAARLNRELSRLLRIANNITNAQDYSEETNPILENMDLCAVLEELAEEAQPLLAALGLQLVTQVPRESCYSPICWPMIRQAIYSLLDNAAKHSPADGTVYLNLKVHGRRMQLCVSDQGPGISLAAASAPHYARQPSLEDGLGGVGLGLALVRSAAAAHQGALLLQTPPQGGTRAVLSLPLRGIRPICLRSGVSKVVHAQDDALVMLSDVLPADLYKPKV